MLAQKNMFHFSTLILTRGGTLRWMMTAHPEHGKKWIDEFLICWLHSPGLHSAPTPSHSTSILKQLARLEIALELLKAPVAVGARPASTSQRQKMDRPIFDMLPPQPHPTPSSNLETQQQELKIDEKKRNPLIPCSTSFFFLFSRRFQGGEPRKAH